MRPMLSDADLDEVDLSLLDVISYVRKYGLTGRQVERLLYERLAEAFEMADAYDDAINAVSTVN